MVSTIITYDVVVNRHRLFYSGVDYYTYTGYSVTFYGKIPTYSGGLKSRNVGNPIHYVLHVTVRRANTLPTQIYYYSFEVTYSRVCSCRNVMDIPTLQYAVACTPFRGLYLYCIYEHNKKRTNKLVCTYVNVR